jgi:hypothetical protein
MQREKDTQKKEHAKCWVDGKTRKKPQSAVGCQIARKVSGSKPMPCHRCQPKYGSQMSERPDVKELNLAHVEE